MDLSSLNALHVIPFTLTILVIRLSVSLPKYRNSSHRKSPRYTTANALIVLGSGGHTSEMIRLMRCINPNRYSPIHMVLANTDTTSRAKIESSGLSKPFMDQIIWDHIPRSREVKQSWLTTPFTTLWALLWSFLLVARIRPDVIVCNGPGKL